MLVEPLEVREAIRPEMVEVVPLEVISLAVGVVLLKVGEVVKLVSIVGKSSLFDIRTQPLLYIKFPVSA